jgi:hypothetical protein
MRAQWGKFQIITSETTARESAMPALGSDLGPSRLPAEEQLRELAGRVQRLEARVAALEARPLVRPTSPGPAPERLAPGGEVPPMPVVLGLLGRTCLALAGALLVRTLTGSGALPKPAGVLLGLVYGLFWVAAAQRAGAAGRRASAGFHAVAALAIVFPLIGEAAGRFQALAPPAAAGALLVVTAALVAVAWRQALPGIAWVAVLACLGTGFALMALTSAISLFCGFFLFLAAVSLWLGDRPEGRGFRWPAAATADGAVLCMVFLATAPGGSPRLAQDLAAPRGLVLALGLAAVYLGTFIVRALARPRSVGRFELLQAPAALVIGLGGALWVAHAAGSGLGLLGLAALVLGLACYGAAFTFVDKQAEGSSDFRFLVSLGLLLVLAGSPALLPARWLGLHFALLGMGAAALGRRFRSRSLPVHGALLLTAAALASGLLGAVWLGFLGAAPGGVPAAALGVLAGLVLACGLLAGRPQGDPGSWALRLPGLALGALALAGLGAVLLLALAPTGWEAPSSGNLAALRTAVLCLMAVAAGALGRWWPSGSMGFLVHPLLGATGLKLLLEDLPRGRPLTLSLAFSCFGAALLIAPRLRKAKGPDPAPVGLGSPANATTEDEMLPSPVRGSEATDVRPEAESPHCTRASRS